MDKDSRIYVAGGKTLIGNAIIRKLQQDGYKSIIGIQGEEPDLTNTEAVKELFAKYVPKYVFLVAGKSGGINANRKYPAEFILNNLLIECNVIHNAYHFGVKKLLYLASSCSYPKYCPQPMRVESLLTGPLEPTNEAYAIAKIAGIKLCQAYRQQYDANFIVGIPANVFGPGDDFDPENSHVIAALINKMYEAKVFGSSSVEIWGTGAPRREFIYVDDLADACLFVMEKYDGAEPINLGSGIDMSIAELATIIKDVIGYNGEIYFDTSRSDGMPLKLLDSSHLMALGWKSATSFLDALSHTFSSFLQTRESISICRSST